MDEKRITLPALLLAALSLAGCRDLVSPNPANAYVWVDTTADPVHLRTRDLSGAGWIKAYTTDETWAEIYRNPSGEFDHNQPLPEEAWHCATPVEELDGVKRGCVASLQVGDEQGSLSTANYGRVYVCTRDFSQTDDRKQCGRRSVETSGFSFNWLTEWFGAREASEPFDASAVFIKDWQGDGAQRIFAGFHEWTNTNNAWDPAYPTDYSGTWSEWPWDVQTASDSKFLGGDAYSVDVGACNEFIPWKWVDRHESENTQTIGNFTAARDEDGNFIPNSDGSIGLGLAEILLDGLIENPINQSTYSQSVKRWLNTLTGVWARQDVSPEFHFRVSDQGKRQLCLVQFVGANNRINAKPDQWWRFDQGIGALFAQWWGLGDCPVHNARIQYCGSVELDGDEQPVFEIDESTVNATMEPYGTFRPICRKQFKPDFEQMVPQMLMEPASIAITDGLSQLVNGFGALLGVTIRRLEPTPTGLYLVTAESFLDPQYGQAGHCINSLESHQRFTTNLQPEVNLSGVPATGITRPMP